MRTLSCLRVSGVMLCLAVHILGGRALLGNVIAKGSSFTGKTSVCSANIKKKLQLSPKITYLIALVNTTSMFYHDIELIQFRYQF